MAPKCPDPTRDQVRRIAIMVMSSCWVAPPAWYSIASRQVFTKRIHYGVVVVVLDDGAVVDALEPFRLLLLLQPAPTSSASEAIKMVFVEN